MKIFKKNNWENITYVDGHNHPIEFKEGATELVKLPDGEEIFVLIKAQKLTKIVHDHGNNYPVEQKIYGFIIDVHGLRLWVDIEDVELLRGKKHV